MEKEELIKILSRYRGETIEDPEYIIFRAANRIKSYYTDGTVCRDEKVLCSLEYRKKTKSIFYLEDTHQILGGGMLCDDCTQKDLEKIMNRYNFEKLKYIQMSLFDGVTSRRNSK